MAFTIECPQCQRRLNVPETLQGRRVKCPSCATEFEAVETVLPATESEAVSPQRAPAPPPQPAGNPFDYDAPQAHPQRDLFSNADTVRPHRGAVILTLGILGLCLACCPLAGWILGGCAMGMGSADLYEMARGRMDRSGRGMTQAGKICGTIGVVLATVGTCLRLFMIVANQR